jgi:hypothetical protein
MDNPEIRRRSDREFLEYVMECIEAGDCFIADEPLHHTTGGWLCMPVPIRTGQDRQSIYKEAEYLAESLAKKIGSCKLRVDREALWHSHPGLDMEDSLIAPTQVILPGEEASKVRKYPICFGDMSPPSVEITNMTTVLQNMEVGDRNDGVAKPVSSPRSIVSSAKPYDAKNEEIGRHSTLADTEIHAPIALRFDHAEYIPQRIERWEAMTQAVYDGELDDDDVEIILQEHGIKYAELDDLIESDCHDRAAKLRDVEMLDLLDEDDN